MCSFASYKRLLNKVDLKKLEATCNPSVCFDGIKNIQKERFIKIPNKALEEKCVSLEDCRLCGH